MFNATIDVATTLLFAGFCHAMMAGVLLLFWRNRRTGVGFGWWVACEALVATGQLLALGRAWSPGIAMVLIANTCLIFSVPMVETGLRTFLGQQTRVAMLRIWGLAGIVYLGWLLGLLAGWETATRAMWFSGGLLLQAGFAVNYVLRIPRSGAMRLPINLMLTSVLMVAGALLARLFVLAPQLGGTYNIQHDTALALLNISSIFSGFCRTCAALMLVHTRIEAELRRTQARLEERANTDWLTGVASRDHFETSVALLQANAARAGCPVTLLLFDIDHFKSINDSHGHQAGDLLLQRIGQLTRDAVRDGDLVGRLGGDEFAVLFYNCDLSAAEAVADRLREQVKLLPTPGKAVGLSGGLTLLQPGERFTSAYQRADMALYAAKGAGRNQLKALAPPLPA
ncbi:GGDEF domain-containing protein [Jeongeupia naejangsanensis]|uniref:diguanylate cyclase n=1 Tax=Jeongeupia naejangsanensis TaxID=613195 RepID=A0ABS2BLC3_9NEIS|nr:GGDEF domain-containing protein [Jeongeupia naejangsanensis]MBM3115791.1 GGDEF domain-containing protein [Jeongeupia naejangsanensis]